MLLTLTTVFINSVSLSHVHYVLNINIYLVEMTGSDAITGFDLGQNMYAKCFKMSVS